MKSRRGAGLAVAAGLSLMHWWIRHAFLLVPAQALVAQRLESLREFPPRQRPASFNMDHVLETLEQGQGN